jgi:hypothetical protein
MRGRATEGNRSDDPRGLDLSVGFRPSEAEHFSLRLIAFVTVRAAVSPFAGIRFRGRYWGQSGHALLHCRCPLMTQSGHGPS